MNLDQYQEAALTTAIYPPNQAIEYTVLGLVSEAGEVAGKLKKVIRDNGGVLTPTLRDALMDELGDVLWYVAAVAEALDEDLSVIAARNLDKLASRQARGTLTGSGDQR